MPELFPLTNSSFLSRYFLRLAIFISVIIPLISHAQAPGYMGKRWAAGYGLNVSPALLGATINDRTLNYIHELYIDYATSTRWQIGFSARFYKTVYDNKISLSKGDIRPANYYLINGTSLCLNFKHYKGNFIAPWGKYFMFGPVLNIARTSYDPYMYVTEQTNKHDTLISDFGSEKQMYFLPDLMFGWGKTRIIADKITIDYGINCQLFSFFSVITDELRSYSIIYTNDNYISETYKERVHGINRINLFLKVGYLF